VDAAVREYPVVSVRREGQHQCWPDLVWRETVIWPVLEAARRKSERMQRRPQVLNRKKAWRTKRRRRTQPLVSGS